MGDKVALYATPGSRILVVRSWLRAVLVLAMGSFVVTLDAMATGLSATGWVLGAVSALMAGFFVLESLVMGPRLVPVLLVHERSGRFVFTRPMTLRRGGFGRFPVGVPLTLWHRTDVGYPGIMRWRLAKVRYRIVHGDGAIAWNAGTPLAPDSLDRLEQLLRVHGTELTQSEEPWGGLLHAALDESRGAPAAGGPEGKSSQVVLRPEVGRSVAIRIPTHSRDLTVVPLGADSPTTPDGRQRLTHDAVAEHMFSLKAPGSASMQVTIAFEVPPDKPLRSSHTFGAWTDRLALVDDHSDKSAQIYLRTFVIGVDVYDDQAMPSDVVLRLRAEN